MRPLRCFASGRDHVLGHGKMDQRQSRRHATAIGPTWSKGSVRARSVFHGIIRTDHPPNRPVHGHPRCFDSVLNIPTTSGSAPRLDVADVSLNLCRNQDKIALECATDDLVAPLGVRDEARPESGVSARAWGDMDAVHGEGASLAVWATPWQGLLSVCATATNINEFATVPRLGPTPTPTSRGSTIPLSPRAML